MRRILFISLSNIGDAIMTTPVLERLHQLYPDASIDLICDKRSKILFQHCPYRGEIIIKDKRADKLTLARQLKGLRKTRYDLIVDLRTDGLAYLLRARQRLTKWGRKAYGPHAVEELISIIHRINPDKVIPPTTTWLDDTSLAQAEQLTDSLPGSCWLAMGPGANWPPKTWASDKFAEVANALKDAVDAVIILGGPKDLQECEATQALLNMPFIELAGKTDLLGAAAVIKKCSLFIGNDSGLGHLASAVGTPSITVFGPGRPQRYHPWSPVNRYLCGNDQSFTGLATDDVVTAARELLAHVAG